MKGSHAAPPCDTLPFEQMIERRSPSVEDQEACFLDAAYAADEPQTLEENFRFMSDAYASEEAKDALVDGVSSLGIAGYSESWSASDSVINTHLRYDMSFMERFYLADRDDESLEFGHSMDAELPATYDTDSMEAEHALDFELLTEQRSGIGFALDPDREYEMQDVPANINWPIELQAPCFFFANYVVENTSNSKGYLSYLPSLCESDALGGFLRDTVTSLGLVGLAMRRRDTRIMNSARVKYASALNQLNVALTYGEGAFTDQALTTVFLLGLYEVSQTLLFPLIAA